MTQRRRLDMFLAEHAAEAGAELRDGTRVEVTEVAEDGVSARVGDEVVRADVLVGADGANGVVARAAEVGDGDRPWRRARGERAARRPGW